MEKCHLFSSQYFKEHFFHEILKIGERKKIYFSFSVMVFFKLFYSFVNKFAVHKQYHQRKKNWRKSEIYLFLTKFKKHFYF